MRTRILTIAALLLGSVTTAKAQVGQYRNDLAIGVNGGYVMNKVSFNPTIKQDYHTGFTAGLTVRYTSERYFNVLCAVQAEVNFAQMGWKERIEYAPEGAELDTYERTINYVQVPLLARLAYGREHRGVSGYLLLGPQLGFVIGESEKRTGSWTEASLALRPNNVTAQYDLDVQRKFEYGLTGGLGMEISTAAGHFLLEGRYFYALSDIFKNGKADDFSRSANGAIIIKMSYLFDVVRTKK